MNPGAEKGKDIKVQNRNALLKVLKIFMTKEKIDDRHNEQGDETRELLDSINNARMEWISASNNFDFANDHDSVDYYTYKMKACQLRYNYLIKKAKEKGIKVNLPRAQRNIADMM